MERRMVKITAEQADYFSHISESTELRKEIWALMKAIEDSKYFQGKYRELCLLNLQMARLSLGNSLRELDPSQDPYLPTRNKRRNQGSEEIAPTADTAKQYFGLLEHPIQLCDQLHDLIDKFCVRVRYMHRMVAYRNLYSPWYVNFIEEAEMRLRYAQNYVGCKLAEIRDASETD